MKRNHRSATAHSLAPSEWGGGGHQNSAKTRQTKKKFRDRLRKGRLRNANDVAVENVCER